MQIGRRIREERKNKNKTQTQLSEILNTTQDTISLWEKGKSTPNIEDIIKLAEYFDITIEELIGIEKNTNGKYIIYNNVVNENHGSITYNQK